MGYMIEHVLSLLTSDVVCFAVVVYREPRNRALSVSE